MKRNISYFGQCHCSGSLCKLIVVKRVETIKVVIIRCSANQTRLFSVMRVIILVGARPREYGIWYGTRWRRGEKKKRTIMRRDSVVATRVIVVQHTDTAQKRGNTVSHCDGDMRQGVFPVRNGRRITIDEFQHHSPALTRSSGRDRSRTPSWRSKFECVFFFLR